MNNINKIKHNECTGCFSCLDICPVCAIGKTEKNGFFYPKIYDNCINCGKCLKNCPVEKKYNFINQEHKLFAYSYGLDSQKILSSASGAAFFSLADYFINNNGIVYGAHYDSDMKVKHCRINSSNEIKKLQGSKYIQSDLENIYKSVLNDLKNGKKVLFSGVPCQVMALRNFLEAFSYESDNIYFVDLICHGVSSPIIWQDYLHFIEKKYKLNIIDYSFRNKKVSWENYNIDIINKENKKINDTTGAEIFINLFCKDVILRPSCFQCDFCKTTRVGDITIGDCWGIKEKNPELYNKNGVSFVKINTKQGFNLIDIFKNSGEFNSIEIENYIQTNLRTPTKKPVEFEEFWEMYNEKGFNEVSRKYGGYNFIRNLKKIIKKILRKGA